MPEPQHVLIVDDDEHFRSRLGRAMETRGFAVTLAGGVKEAIRLARSAPPLERDLRPPAGAVGSEFLPDCLSNHLDG